MSDANSNASTDQSSAGTAAQQSAGQTTETQAGAGVRGVNSGAGAQGALAQEETVADIGQAESNISDIARATKRAEAVSGDFDQFARGHAQRLMTLSELALQNAVALANRQNNNVGSHDMRVNSISEGLISSMPVYQDAIEAAVVKALIKAGVKA